MGRQTLQQELEFGGLDVPQPRVGGEVGVAGSAEDGLQGGDHRYTLGWQVRVLGEGLDLGGGFVQGHLVGEQGGGDHGTELRADVARHVLAAVAAVGEVGRDGFSAGLCGGGRVAL